MLKVGGVLDMTESKVQEQKLINDPIRVDVIKDEIAYANPSSP